MAIAVVAAADTLGMGLVGELLANLARLLPQVLAGVLVVFGGVVFAEVAYNGVANAAGAAGLPYAGALARAVQLSIVVVAAVMGAHQAGIDSTFLMIALPVARRRPAGRRRPRLRPRLAHGGRATSSPLTSWHGSTRWDRPSASPASRGGSSRSRRPPSSSTPRTAGWWSRRSSSTRRSRSSSGGRTDDAAGDAPPDLRPGPPGRGREPARGADRRRGRRRSWPCCPTRPRPACSSERGPRSAPGRCPGSPRPAPAPCWPDSRSSGRRRCCAPSSPSAREGLLAALPGAERLRALIAYEPGTAGALMDPSVLALPATLELDAARQRLGESSANVALELYVVDAGASPGRRRRPPGGPGPGADRKSREPGPRPGAAARGRGPGVAGRPPGLAPARHPAGGRRPRHLPRSGAQRAAAAGGPRGVDPRSRRGTDATLALGELFWLGLTGMLSSLAPRSPKESE